jgi:uncharacterized protein YggU (UPF0235/DUF167 family)
MSCYSTEPTGIVLAVRVTPRSRLDGIEGVGTLSDGRRVLTVRLRAVPADGAANASLTALLAKLLKVPKSAVAVIGGGSSRLKRVRVTGPAQQLAALVDGFPDV